MNLRQPAVISEGSFPSSRLNKNILAEKLIKNFNSGFPVNNTKAIKLNKYSEEIFYKVIKEYERIIL